MSRSEGPATNSEAITVRPYEDRDWPEVCRVHDRARPDELRGSCDPRGFVPLADDKEDAEVFHRSRKLVACAGDQVVAFVGVDGTCVTWLYVDPPHYGRGIGRRLLRLAKEMTGPEGWTISLEGNVRARALYESEGFRVVRTFQGDNAGYPCVCLRMALSPEA